MDYRDHGPIEFVRKIIGFGLMALGLCILGLVYFAFFAKRPWLEVSDVPAPHLCITKQPLQGKGIVESEGCNAFLAWDGEEWEVVALEKEGCRSDINYFLVRTPQEPPEECGDQ